MVRYTRQGYPYRCLTFHHSPTSPAVFLSTVEDSAELMLQKPASRRTEGESAVGSEDGQFIKKYPTLWEWMTAPKWADGSTRQPSSVLFFAADGLIKCMLRDKDEGHCLWVAGPGFTQALQAMEAALNDPGAAWRVDRQGEAKKASRVRKAS